MSKKNIVQCLILLVITLAIGMVIYIKVQKKIEPKKTESIKQTDKANSGFIIYDTVVDSVSSVVIDSNNSNKNKIEKDKIVLTKRKYDPEIKPRQYVGFENGEYYCSTDGWDHGDITYSNFISGTFEYIKNHKQAEKKKCEDFLYGTGFETSKNLKELENQ